MFDSGRNLTYELVNVIGAAIVNGEYSPDKKFTNIAEIADKYSLSSTITKEAIKILYAKGLLSIRQRIGISVSPPEKWNLFDTDVLAWVLHSNSAFEFFRELSELRVAVEPMAANLAALNPHRIDMMHDLKSALNRIKSSDIKSNSLIEAETDFHAAILSASNNPYFLDMQKFIKLSIAMRHSLQNKSNNIMRPNHSDYEAIFDAITSGNGSLAFQTSHALAMKISNFANTLISSK